MTDVRLCGRAVFAFELFTLVDDVATAAATRLPTALPTALSMMRTFLEAAPDGDDHEAIRDIEYACRAIARLVAAAGLQEAARARDLGAEALLRGVRLRLRKHSASVQWALRAVGARAPRRSARLAQTLA